MLWKGSAAEHELKWEVESEWEWTERHDIFLRILDPERAVGLQTPRWIRSCRLRAFLPRRTVAQRRVVAGRAVPPVAGLR